MLAKLRKTVPHGEVEAQVKDDIVVPLACGTTEEALMSWTETLKAAVKEEHIEQALLLTLR